MTAALLPKSLKSLLALPLLGAALLAAPGCTDPNAPTEARRDTYGPTWLTLGPNLRNRVIVGDVTPLRDRETGVLRVAIPVRSTYEKQQYIQYRMTFLDGAGMQVNDVTGTITIPARGSQTINANSSSDRAQTFQVFMGYPRVN